MTNQPKRAGKIASGSVRKGAKMKPALRRILNRNEMLRPPAPRVVAALRKFDIGKASLYLEGYHGSRLAPVLAQRFGVPREQVSVGYGIEFFLRAIFDSLIPGKDDVLVADPHFAYYSHYAAVRGVRVLKVPLIDAGHEFRFDVTRTVVEIERQKPKVVLLTSPNNPTGDIIAPRDFVKVLEAAGPKTLVILDEAYHGFNKQYDEKQFVSLLARYPNMVILRTFSKEYGLAGMRIGFALWGSEAKKLVRYEDLYLGGSRILEEAAIAVLASEPYYRKMRAEIVRERETFRKAVGKLKHFTAYASHTNFVFVRIAPGAIGAVRAALDVASPLVARFVGDDAIRVSIGLPKDMKAFAEVLKKIDAEIA